MKWIRKRLASFWGTQLVNALLVPYLINKGVPPDVVTWIVATVTGGNVAYMGFQSWTDAKAIDKGTKES